MVPSDHIARSTMTRAVATVPTSTCNSLFGPVVQDFIAQLQAQLCLSL